MRRLLAILLVASPLAASALTSGQITFSPNASVNATECAAGSGATLGLTWTTQLETSVLFNTNGQYRVFASNKDFGTASPYCYMAGDSAGTSAAQLTTNPTTIDATFQSVTANVEVAVPDVIAAAGYDCSTNRTIYLCVLWFQTSDSADMIPHGWAKGTVSLSAAQPNAPTVVDVRPGDRQLEVTLSDNTGGAAEADSWRAKAVLASEYGTPGAVAHYSDWQSVSDTKLWIKGLVNFEDYSVTAYSRSKDLNVSAESARYALDVAPQPVDDFWERYKDAAGGRDSGGCQAGAAGLAALLGAAALLRIRRRS